ncbi:MAG: glycosyltransferase family 4 protein [Candidatus Aenigmarchaeota archaeon]|nr:glycosyltransferase family 4 protein [Candidatus Aenigmarchaeota archaeon]
MTKEKIAGSLHESVKLLKVLHINETHREVGGQERYFFGLINGLRERGIDTYSFGFDTIARKTGKSLVLKTPGYFMKQFNRFVFDFNAYFKLRSWITKIHPDIIHLHGLNQSTLAILFACRGHKVVQTVHNYGMICSTIWCVTKDDLKPCCSGAGLKCWRRKCIALKYLIPFYFHIKIRNFFLKRLVNVYHAPSKALKVYLNKIGYEPVEVINYFIDVKEMSGNEKKEYDIVFVGRLDVEKGVKFLLDAIGVLKKEHPNIKAVIVGDGPEIEKLQEHARKLGLVNSYSFSEKNRDINSNLLRKSHNTNSSFISEKSHDTNSKNPDGFSYDTNSYSAKQNSHNNCFSSKNSCDNVDFVGRADFDAVKKYYAKSRIFVMPSVYMEQFGFVGIEAMSNSLPSVAGNRGGIPEWCIDNKTGLLVDPTKPLEIANAIDKLLSDKKLAKRLGDNAKAYAKNFDKKGLIDEVIKLYNSLLNK